jgi:hypothetical protein
MARYNIKLGKELFKLKEVLKMNVTKLWSPMLAQNF